ncbi:hypothetical protein KIN20_020866 [Parelaphostrongylus tenuis]|uniref:Uncharacterized protein n=1 Tax=Parelaphostrongylus tenuis TaxID=148309 RepID=A0AAD5MRW1_PARTN|nr:hypothetical protein KIN20_020866 [Parelaphostrongylus tenuis]
MPSLTPQKMTAGTFDELEGVESLSYPPYSPDAAPSDYGSVPLNGAFFIDPDSTHLIPLKRHVTSFLIQSPWNGDFEQIQRTPARQNKRNGD